MDLAVGYGQGYVLFPDEIMNRTLSVIWKRGTERPVVKTYPDLVACVQYKFSFGEQIKQSSVLYAVAGSADYKSALILPGPQLIPLTFG